MACGPRIMRLGGGSEWRMRQRRASLPQTVEPCKRLRHGSGRPPRGAGSADGRPAVYESSAVAAVINTNDTTTEAEMANPAISVSPSIHIT